MTILENEVLAIAIHPSGAELHSIFDKKTQVECLWNGDESFWPRRSPVLFPIVGGLKDNQYQYKSKRYSLPKHGFARDMIFSLENSRPNYASFMLRSNEDTQKLYPFEFELFINYHLDKNRVFIEYQVKNPASEPLFFSIGAHPAFNVPLTSASTYEDYYLEFSETESAPRYTLSENLINGSEPFLINQKSISLNHQLFKEDALIFKDLHSDSVVLKNHKNDLAIKLDFSGFPFLGIWAAKDAPFVCIEPWCGLADNSSHNQQLEEKEGIVKLTPQQSWSRTWTIEIIAS